MISEKQTEAQQFLPESPQFLFSDSIPLDIPPTILTTIRTLETQLKHIWSDSHILIAEIHDKRLYLALCIAHRHLLQSILEFTIFPGRLDTNDISNNKFGKILRSEREVRKFARRIWQYLERVRNFIGEYHKFDKVDVNILLDEAVKSTKMAAILQLNHHVGKDSMERDGGIDLGHVARGRFLLRLHESLKRKSFNRDSVFLMEEAQIRACIADVRDLLSPTSISRQKRRDEERVTHQSKLWTWLMKKTAFLTINDSSGDSLDEMIQKTTRVVDTSTHSGSRESRLFGSSDSSEFIQPLPMRREETKQVVRTVEMEEPLPHVGIPEISANTRLVNSITMTSQTTSPDGRTPSPISSPIINTSPINSGFASPQVEARMITSGRLNILSPISDPRIFPVTMINGTLLSPKGKSPLNSPITTPTGGQEEQPPFHPLILNTFKTTAKPLNCSSSTADFILKNSTSTAAFQFKNNNNATPTPIIINTNNDTSNINNDTPKNSPTNQLPTTSKLIKSTSINSMAKSPTKSDASSPPPKSPTIPIEIAGISPTTQGSSNTVSPIPDNSGFVTDYSPQTNMYIPFNMQVNASSAINETELELLTATQASSGFRCAICGIKLSSSSYRHLEGNRRACRKACLAAVMSEQENTNNLNIEEERTLSDAITESIRKTCYT